MDLKEEDILGDSIHGHWYYISKGRAMRGLLKTTKNSSVLDVGAGSGVFARQLLDTTDFHHAVCIDPNYPSEREESHNGKSLSFRRNYTGTPVDLILMMDVLEHVDDDAGLLSQYAPHLQDNGHVLITVPAFKFLWSGHDVFLEHRRRYTKKMLHETLAKAGFEPVKTRFFFAALFPLVILIRLCKKILLRQGRLEARSEMRQVTGPLNCLLILIHNIERMIIFPFNGVAGLSLFCLCKKKATD